MVPTATLVWFLPSAYEVEDSKIVKMFVNCDVPLGLGALGRGDVLLIAVCCALLPPLI